MIDIKYFLSLSGIVVLTMVSLPAKSAWAGYNGVVELKFSGLNVSKGQVCVNLFNGTKGFPDGGKGASLASARCAPVVNRTSKITFTNLAYGIYAVSAVHDLNGDQIANKNFLGIPTEGVAFSNNPRIQNSAPSFSETQFIISRPKTELQVRMNYF